MPELAEVEYFRRQWDPGLKHPVRRVLFHPKARIFRGIPAREFEKTLTGAKLLASETKGKQMIFRFDRAALGLHLGMTGKLRVEPPDFTPGKHDHLVLIQDKRALVFSDPRLFGRVFFHAGADEPDWWAKLPPEVLSTDFTKEALAAFLHRRKAAPIKAVLLMQERFPGIGNWMADEILWQARIAPATRSGALPPEKIRLLWKTIRSVSRTALRTIGVDWSDPPDDWLIGHRWQDGGSCPRCGSDLKRAQIGGRTACWCPRCQR